MNTEPDVQTRQVAIARSVVSQASADQRRALHEWARELLRVREATLPARRKAYLALQASARRDVLAPMLRGIQTQLKAAGLKGKDLLWDQRGWPARLGFGGAAIGVMAFSGKGAGLAALGGAIGLPLWMVLGAGGTFLGTMVEELRNSQQPGHEIVDIEKLRTIDPD